MPAIMTTDGRYHGHTPDRAGADQRKAALTKAAEGSPEVKFLSDEEWERLAPISGFEARANALKNMGVVI